MPRRASTPAPTSRAGSATSSSTTSASRSAGNGLSSYPHPRLMPDLWEFPTVSMGLGPLSAIYQARFNRYLLNRELADTSESRVWCFVGDGEFDEPETRAALSLAARERLDNLTFVVNCNLQRLDGPVRGNGKIIQELEALLRGCGWNVIKVIWGRRWDELLARDVDGVLVNKMNTTLDGDFQTFATESGAYIREHFFGPDPRLRKLVEHLSDAELQTLPRGGHDYRKLYAAYKAATEQVGAPTAILAKTIKGWTLGPEIEARNATHQIKKMTKEQLRVLRDRLSLQDEIPDEALDAEEPPYYRPAGGLARARVPRRPGAGPSAVTCPTGRSRGEGLTGLPAPLPAAFAEFALGSRGQAVSTTMAFARLLRNLLRDPGIGKYVVPIVPDEGRTFGLDALFTEVKIYSPDGQLYTPVDAGLLLSYAEDRSGQILEEGITEAGAMASFQAAGTCVRDLVDADAADLPLLLDVRLPADRRPDLAGGRRPGAGLPDRLHGRAHDDERRGPPARGRPLAPAGLGRADRARLRPGLRLRDGDHRRARHRAHVRPEARGLHLLPDALQRELPDARAPGARRRRGGAGRSRGGPQRQDPPRHLPLRRAGRSGHPAR